MTFDDLVDHLRQWWCHHYERPYKDPLLDTYTFEELLYEYFHVQNRSTVATEASAEAKEVPQEEYDWAEQAEKEEAEQAEKDRVKLEAGKAAEAEIAAEENGSIEGGLSDEEWAERHDQTKVNPTAEQAEEGGDIDATFGT